MPSEDQDLDAEIAEFVRRLVGGGYLNRDEVVEDAVSYFSEDADEARVRQSAERATLSAILALQTSQAEWPVLTDNDRLEEAFLQLEDQGILARENYSCCGSCGVSEAYTEMDEKAKEGRAVRGYVFFHEQDTEGAVEGGGLYLNYGAASEGEAAALGVAREVVERLEACGLNTEWDGSWDRRIFVHMDWRRRWRCD